MNYNFHTHTVRCHHAEGTEEEYIKEAIKGGILHMGFSEHFPFAFPDGFSSRYRLPINEVTLYLEEIKLLRNKYRQNINLYIGFEMEYYPAYFKKMIETARSYGAEYLILGQHYVSPEHEHPQAKGAVSPTSDPADLTAYVTLVTHAMEQDIFTYVAHPDVLFFTGDVSLYEQEMRKICVKARETNTPLEINFLGIRQRRHYPNTTFWRIAAEEDAPVTFGFDAHETFAANDQESLKTAQKLVTDYKLRYIGMPKLKSL